MAQLRIGGARSRESSPPSQSALKKHRRRARTGKELAEQVNTTQLPLSDSSMYNFEDTSNFVHNTILTIDMFRPVEEEHSALSVFGKRLLHYCSLKLRTVIKLIKCIIILENLSDIDTIQAVNMVHMQKFCALYDKHLQPDVASVVYVNVLDERADDKNTVLNVKEGKRFLVLGDAKTYEIIQNIKEEYGKDLNWLYAYPGDWHLLKNYQNCLMKPFFETGLKELANHVGYPASIQSCSVFKRTHHFLIEVWESIVAWT